MDNFNLLIIESEWEPRVLAQWNTEYMLKIFQPEEHVARYDSCTFDSVPRSILITCSDEGIRSAQKAGLPVLAIRNPDYDQAHGRQSLFGAPVLLEAPDLPETSDIFDRVWYRFNHLPLPILDTARCHIREIAECDLPELYALSGGRLRDREAYAGQSPSYVPSEEDFRTFWSAYIRNQYDFYGYGLWLIEASCGSQPCNRKALRDKYAPGVPDPVGENPHIIGIAGYSVADYPFLSGHQDSPVELSYWIAPAYRRCGYALEVCRALVDKATELAGSEHIHIFIREGNQASVRVAEALGFRLGRVYDGVGYEDEAYEDVAFDGEVHENKAYEDMRDRFLDYIST